MSTIPVPTARRRSRTLGAVRTVWVGDFTPLRAPGRDPVVIDDGNSSHAFDVELGVFDSAVRAVQRAFYYQRAFAEIDAWRAQGPWIHASDAALAPPGVVRAGMTPVTSRSYSASINSALFWLLSAVADFFAARGRYRHSRVKERLARPVGRGDCGITIFVALLEREIRLRRYGFCGNLLQ